MLAPDQIRCLADLTVRLELHHARPLLMNGLEDFEPNIPSFCRPSWQIFQDIISLAREPARLRIWLENARYLTRHLSESELFNGFLRELDEHPP